MERDDKRVVKIKVNDKRRAARQPPSGGGDLHGAHTERGHGDHDAPRSSAGRSSEPAPLPQTPPSSAGTQAEENEFLEDLRRVQADFENYRKRVVRDQESVAARAAAAVVEGLLPVVDNFERAIEHGEGGEGVELVFKDLLATLEREGLEEIPALGAGFDPNVHEAVDSREQDGLEMPTVIEVFRRGYMFKGQLLRPVMVVVGRPAETQTDAAEG